MKACSTILIVDGDAKRKNGIIDNYSENYKIMFAWDKKSFGHIVNDNNNFDIVIIDIDSETFDGLSFINRIRYNFDISNIQIIAISSLGIRANKVKALEYGVSFIIEADYDDAMINNIIDNSITIISKTKYGVEKINNTLDYDELDNALKTGQFIVYIQPIYSISTGRAVCAEALIRWNHPTNGIMSPEIFIPICERNGFVEKLDMFMLGSVLKYIKARLDAGKHIVPISVNLSRMNFRDADLSNRIIDLTQRAGVDPSFIRIEITENICTENPELLSDIIYKLNEQGFLVMIDDFGREYSSLSMISETSISFIKIDRLFVERIGLSSRAGCVITNIIRMAKQLKIEVITEGVETKQQLDFMKNAGCDFIQGYIYSRPKSLEIFSELLDVNESKGLEFIVNANMIPDMQFELIKLKMLFMGNIVEDIKPVIDTFQDEFHILQARDKQEMLEHLNINSDIAIALIDVYNPDIAGKEIIQIMQSDIRLVNIPIIALIKENQYKLVEEVLKLGASNISYKPYRMEILRYKVMNLISQSMLLQIKSVHSVAQSKLNYPVLSKQHTLEASKSILLVDNDLDNCKEIKDLCCHDYNMILAKNGFEALQICANGSCHFVAIIINMDNHSIKCFEFLKLRQKNEIMSQIPIILITAKHDIENENRALLLGATDVVHKPYNYKLILHKLSNIVNYKKMLYDRDIIIEIIENIPSCVAIIEIGNNIECRYCSSGIKEILGTSLEEYKSAYYRHPMNLIYPEDAERLNKKRKSVISSHGELLADFRIMHKSGEYIWAHIEARYVYSDGDTMIYYAMISDVDTKKRNELKIVENNKILNIAFSQIHVRMFEYDIAKDKLWITRAMSDKIQSPIVIDNISTFVVKNGCLNQDSYIQYYDIIRRIKAGQMNFETTLHINASDGENYWIRVVINTIIDISSGAKVAIGLTSDANSETRVLQQSNTDLLTGLLNRLAFETIVDEVLEAAEEQDKRYALFILDIDGFKGINHTYGYSFGDDVICYIAKRLSSMFRNNTDYIARIGGDEIAVLMVDIYSEDTVIEKCREICKKIQLEYKEDKGIEISCSFGIAITPMHGKTFEDMYKSADAAMYKAKRNGINQWDLAERQKC